MRFFETKIEKNETNNSIRKDHYKPEKTERLAIRAMAAENYQLINTLKNNETILT